MGAIGTPNLGTSGFLERFLKVTHSPGFSCLVIGRVYRV